MVDKQDENGKGKETKVSTDLIRPVEDAPGANLRWFLDAENIDIKTDYTEELSTLMAELAFMSAYWESPSLIAYQEEINRKRISIRRGSRQEWVNSAQQTKREELKNDIMARTI